MSHARHRAGRQAFWLTVAAFAWSAALVGAAFVLPLYGSSSTSSTGAHFSAGPTLIDVNGPSALIPMGIPLVVVALVWAALHRKCARGGRIPNAIAWSFAGVLAAGCLVAIASVGLLILPVAALLLCATATTPSGGAPVTTS
jgi:hypothetical protein